MTTTMPSLVNEGDDEEMNITSIFNETNSNIENRTSSSNITTLSNEEKSFGMYSVLCIKGFIFGSIILGAILGNFLVILAVRRNRKLRYVNVIYTSVNI